MADEQDILQKADALMRRHRVFVAGGADTASAAEATDDVPVLTEVVDPASVQTPGVETPVDLVQLRNALAFELEAWLDEELPKHVMRVLDGITDQMIGQLSQKARFELLPRLQARAEAAKAGQTPDDTDAAPV